MVYLCHNRCHISGKDAVHRSASADQKLKAEWQEKLMEEHGWTEDDFRLTFGKSYLTESAG